MKGLEVLLATYAWNSLWQAPLLFCAAWTLQRLLRRAPLAWSYRLWVATLLAQVITPAVTILSVPLPGVIRWLAWPRSHGKGSVEVLLGPAFVHRGSGVPEGFVLCIAGLYTAATLWAMLRLILGLRCTQQLRRDLIAVAPAPPIRALWERCNSQLGLRATVLAESRAVRAPLTVGIRRRCVLLPPGLMQQMSEAELEAVFAHECAHMRRQDFAVNILLRLITLPVAFHSVVWLTHRRVSEAREWVCDAQAASSLAAPALYARSLLHLADRLLPLPKSFTPHAIGVLDANTLERRLMQLMHRSTPLTLGRRVALLSTCLTVGALTCGAAVLLPAPVSPQTSSGTPQGPKIVRISSGVMAANNVSKAIPVYPPAAKEAHITGSVVMAAVIGTDGTVNSLQVVSGPEELQDAALDAVWQWTYKPYLLNGVPTAVDTTITVTFSLNP